MSSKLNQLKRRVRKLRGRRQNHTQITDSSKKADATEVHKRGSADNKRSTSTDDGESTETTNQTPEEEGASKQRELESFTKRKGAIAQTYLWLCDDELPLLLALLRFHDERKYPLRLEHLSLRQPPMNAKSY